MKRSIQYIILLILGFSNTTLTAQSGDPFYLHYDVNHDIPSSEVHDVAIGKDGLIWICTDRGICSYDGYSFQAYSTRDGLSDNSIIKMIKDPKGRLWFVGLNATLNYLDNGKIHTLKHPKNIALATNGLWVEGLAWDQQDHLYFWPKAFPKRPLVLSRYSLNTGQTSTFTPEQGSNQLTKIKFHQYQFHLLDQYLLPDTSLHLDISYLLQDSLLYIALEADHTAYLYNLNQQRLQQQYPIQEEIDGFYLDNLGSLFITTAKGLFHFKDHQLNSSPKHYFKDYSITGILQDQEFNYWISTLQAGVFKIPSFTVSSLRLGTSRQQHQKVWSFVKGDKVLYGGTSNGSIIQIDTQFQLKKISPTLFTSEAERYGKLSLASRQGNLFYFGPIQMINTSKGPSFYHPYNGRLKQPILPLSNGQHFLYGPAGIAIADQQFGHKQHLPKSLTPKRITKAIEYQNQIWMATLSGFFVIDDLQFEKIHPIKITPAIDQQRVNDFAFDTAGNLYAATMGNGLVYRVRDTIFQLTVSDGLNSDLLNCLYLENDSTVWLGSNQGVNCLRFRSGQTIPDISSYTIQDGLNSQFINDITSFNQHIFIAHNQGINYFPIKTVTNQPIPRPRIRLNEFSVNGRDQPLPPLDRRLTLPYNQNNLRFRFTGISYRKPSKFAFYRFRLLSSHQTNTSWNLTDDQSVHYNDLPPGWYTFQAAARNQQGQWSERPIHIQLRIRPHFTQTRLFQLAVFLLGLGLCYFVFRLIQTNERRRQQVALADLKTKEAELLALRNQMNPHFVYNVLNSIQNFIFSNDIVQANHYLSNFSKLMRDGLQFARLQYISIKEEIDFLQNYLELEQMRFPDTFSFQLDIEEDLPVHQYFIPALILQPILENAVKHAFQHIDYPGHIQVEFREKYAGEFIEVVIQDNGVGFRQSQQIAAKSVVKTHQSLGLQIIRQQISLLNSKLHRPKAALDILDLSDNNVATTGTQVTLILPIRYDKKNQNHHH